MLTPESRTSPTISNTFSPWQDDFVLLFEAAVRVERLEGPVRRRVAKPLRPKVEHALLIGHEGRCGEEAATAARVGEHIAEGRDADAVEAEHHFLAGEVDQAA